jgi:ribosomal-protein-alanine N-acetyltransferase
MGHYRTIVKSAVIPSIRTPRLTLRPLIPIDAEILYNIYQVEGVLNYFPNPKPPPLENVHRFIHSQESHWEHYNYGNWGILPDKEQSIIGWAGLQFLAETKEIEVGYLLNCSFWGHGYATESALASLAYGFNQIKIDQIIALVHPENKASRRVIEKCGMSWVDLTNYFGINLMRYRITRSEFQMKDMPIQTIIYG